MDRGTALTTREGSAWITESPENDQQAQGPRSSPGLGSPPYCRHSGNREALTMMMSSSKAGTGKAMGRQEHGRIPAPAFARSPREALDGKAGLLAPGSSYSRTFPHGQPLDRSGGSTRAVVFSGFVPGYSGGGRAGLSPASLSKTQAASRSGGGGSVTTPSGLSKRSPTAGDLATTIADSGSGSDSGSAASGCC